MSVKIPSEVFQKFILLIESKISILQSTRDGEAALQALEEIKSKAEELKKTRFTEDEVEQQTLSVREDTPAVQSLQIDPPNQGRVKTRRKRVSRKISKVCAFH